MQYNLRFEVATGEFLIYRDSAGYVYAVINGSPAKGRCIDDSYEGGREEFEMPQGSDPSMFFGPHDV